MKPKHLFAVALLLTACEAGTVKNTLGLSRSAPDEFRVVSRPPLSVPPDFVLRPPGVDGEMAGPSAAEQAKSLVLGNKSAAAAAKKSGVSSAESKFLQRAGADKANPAVRSSLIEEKVAVQDQKEESSWWDVLSDEPAAAEPTVDAKKEAERIRTNDESGQPVTQGATPEIKPRDRGVLGKIMGE